MTTATSPVEIALPPLTGPQLEIAEAMERCVLIEGSPRSAKSWGAAMVKIWRYALQHPGIQIFYCRYKDESLITLRDIWGKVSVFFPSYLQPRWNATDQCWDFPPPPHAPEPPPGQHYGSRVFLSSIRSADIDNIHSKYKGKTLAVIVVEEASEVPQRNYRGLKERLSQARTPWGTPYDYPLQIILVTNCVDEDHWIAQEFPTTNTKPHHRYIRADLYSNAGNLGPQVIAGYESDYPEGHPERRTILEGKRGLTLLGTPVYKKQFKRSMHVSPAVQFNPYYPLLEGWDFGEEKPAVTWYQYLTHLAALRILGGVKGSEVYLETFGPKVKEIRGRLFPHATEIRSWCDPSGETGNHGLQGTAVKLLHQLGIPVAFTPNANQAPIRYSAIQTLGGYMLRTAVDGSPAFLMAPTCIELVWDGDSLVERETELLQVAFEAGYVWDDKAPPEGAPNVRKPKKGTRYDDLMNAGEYIVIGEQIPLAPTVQQITTAAARYQTAPERQQLQQLIAARKALRAEQRDTHPIDGRARKVPGVAVPSRTGRRSFY